MRRTLTEIKSALRQRLEECWTIGSEVVAQREGQISAFDHFDVRFLSIFA